MRTLLFAKRNFKEMVRDPLIYIFCLAFPLLMLLLFVVIGSYTQGMAVFELKSLVPGIMLFSFTFVMLLESLLVSKDRTGAFLVRLYTTPMKAADFVFGYAMPCIVIGILQEICCVLFGWILSLMTGTAYFSLGATLLLMLWMLPMLVMFVFFGIFFGTCLNDKAAPGICSAIITCCGVFSGAWMPLDTMAGFETFCRVMPFYPAVYIGRIITGAEHTFAGDIVPVYEWDSVASFGLIPIALCFALSVFLAVFTFWKKSKQ